MIREPRERWRDPRAGEEYARRRWSSRRHEQRDPRLVARLLRRLGAAAPPAGARVLDVPCGTGRLVPGLTARGYDVVAADASPSMLAAREARGARYLAADAAALPFRSGSFDLVVCCRLLHHLADEASLRAVIAELVRVSRGHVVASYWDAGAWPELARGARARVGKLRPRGRVARPRATVADAFDAAGATVLGHVTSLRFVSRQTFLVARVGPAR